MNTNKKLETIPLCNKDYVLTYKNKSCKCIYKNTGNPIAKKKVTLKNKSNQCKPGKMKNENGRCVLIPPYKPKKKVTLKKNVNESTKKPISLKNISNPCKKGKIKNENGRCVLIKNLNKPKKTIVNPIIKKRSETALKTKKILRDALFTSASPPSTIIKSKNTVEQNLIKNEISKIIEKQGDTDIILNKSSAQPLLSRIKSYSPAVNQEFVTNNEDRADIFKCATSFDDLLLKYKISIGKNKNGKPTCRSLNSQQAKDVLINNLNNIRINEDQIIAPIQKHSNCWFNALFVCFFFSDKGRKFFKYFRRLMILGKYPDGSNMPEKLARGLTIWNLCIEASYDNKDLALSMNTNKVIEQIYKSLTKKQKKDNNEIRNIKQAGNPVYYYFQILRNVLKNKELPFFLPNVDKSFKIMEQRSLKDAGLNTDTPDVIFFQFHGLNRFKGSNIDFLKIKLDNIIYQLDSVTVRDTAKRHFCALITVNGKGMGFDGASFSRLSPFDWKPRLQNIHNRNIDWEFEGSIFKGGKENGKPIIWNFNESYLILKYYRI